MRHNPTIPMHQLLPALLEENALRYGSMSPQTSSTTEDLLGTADSSRYSDVGGGGLS